MTIAIHEAIALWRAAGGTFHGPNIETGSMLESVLIPFIQALVGDQQSLGLVAERVVKIRPLQKE